MSGAGDSAIAELELGISRFYERYSAKKVAQAAFIVGVFSIGLSYVFYSLTTMMLVAVIAFAMVGFISVNLTMLFVVPPANRLTEARELICAAIREPARIKAFDIKEVKVADKEGNVHTLSSIDLVVWRTMVVPYFVQSQVARAPATEVKSERTLTASERKYIEERRREVLEIEKKIDEERKQLDKERREMETRISEIREREKAASEKLAKADSVNIEAIEKASAQREAKLKKLEAELIERQEKIQKEGKELEERTQYIANVEDSLVERLDDLSTREASVEQGEINAGLRREK